MKIVFACAQNMDPGSWLGLLQQALPQAEIILWDETAQSTDATLAIAWNPPADLFLREKNIKAVFNLGAGVDALLRLPGLHDGITLVRLEDAGMAVQMAEYVVYALVRASRNFDSYQRQQVEQHWQPLPAIQRQLWPVGVLGTGVMGSRVAQVLAALDYPIATWSRSGKQQDGVQSFAGQLQFSDFLARTRVLVNTLPLTPDTHGILGRENFQQLLPDAYIINVGRGEHLVEEDLLAMLDDGAIQGATLDVFSQEPLPADHPFWRHPGITLTPHVSAASLRQETVDQIAGKIQNFVLGKAVTGVVAHDRGY